MQEKKSDVSPAVAVNCLTTDGLIAQTLGYLCFQCHGLSFTKTLDLHGEDKLLSCMLVYLHFH